MKDPSADLHRTLSLGHRGRGGSLASHGLMRCRPTLNGGREDLGLHLREAVDFTQQEKPNQRFQQTVATTKIDREREVGRDGRGSGEEG
jgi:hypothetical protein